MNSISIPQKPLKGFENQDTFKLFLSDVGILNNLLNVSINDILMDELEIYKGVIAENYVANQLISNEIPIFYWRSDAEAEVDFLIETTSDGIIPIEVKASDNTQSKSLKVYDGLYHPKYKIRISTKDFGYEPKASIKSIPLYAAFLIRELTK